MQQAANIEQVFREFFSHYVPKRIIELGTGTGEFTNLLRRLREDVDKDFDLITIDQHNDIKEIPWPIVFIQMHVFQHFDIIRDLIQRNTLVLCDNGNKIVEITRLSDYLFPDCVIMAHDYCETKEDLGKYWGCCEITWDDVKDLGLEKYQYKLMKTAGWLSLKK